MLLIAFLASTACVRVPFRPSHVTLATGQQISNTYVAASPAATFPAPLAPIEPISGQGTSPAAFQIDTNGFVSMIGPFYNIRSSPIVLDVSKYEVCWGSELRYDRPPQDDPCWRRPGVIQNMVIPAYNGSSPWLRVPTNGGYVVFTYSYPINAGRVQPEVVKQAIDFYPGDWVCPGNRLVDFYFVAGYDLRQHGGVPYCQSTRLLR